MTDQKKEKNYELLQTICGNVRTRALARVRTNR